MGCSGDCCISCNCKNFKWKDSNISICFMKKNRVFFSFSKIRHITNLFSITSWDFTEKASRIIFYTRRNISKYRNMYRKYPLLLIFFFGIFNIENKRKKQKIRHIILNCILNGYQSTVCYIIHMWCLNWGLVVAQESKKRKKLTNANEEMEH